MLVKFGCVEDKAPLFLTRKLGQGLLQNGGRTAVAESLLLTVVDSGRDVPTLSGFRCIAAPGAQLAKAPVIKDVEGTPSERQAAEWRDGHYLLRSNPTAGCSSVLWARYVQLTQIESVFRSLKSELGIRPIYHQLEHRTDAHIPIAFPAYCLQITLKHRLLVHAPGLTPTAVLEKLAEIQMIDVWIPTVDQRWLILARYTQPSSDTKLLIEKLRLELPSQPAPRLTAQKESNEIEVQTFRYWLVCGEDLSIAPTDSKALNQLRWAQLRKIG